MIDPYADYSLAGRVAVVTGASSGIGACSAELLAAAGAAVVLADLEIDGAKSIAERINDDGGSARAVHCDVARKSDIDASVDLALEQFGQLDIMANIAGIMNGDRLVDVDQDTIDHLIAVNMKGALFGCQAAMRAMMGRRSGSIINFASTAIYHPAPNMGLYSMTKAAVAMLTMDLAVEAGEYGIRVNCVVPGPTPTNFGRSLRTDGEGNPDPVKTEAYIARNTALSPLRRLGEPIDQAHMVHYLAADASKFATGGIFAVNGGVDIVW